MTCGKFLLDVKWAPCGLISRPELTHDANKAGRGPEGMIYLSGQDQRELSKTSKFVDPFFFLWQGHMPTYKNSSLYYLKSDTEGSVQTSCTEHNRFYYHSIPN